MSFDLEKVVTDRRPHRSALLGSTAYLLLGAGALVLVRPASWWSFAGWLLAMAAAGLLFPGLANQVTMVRAYLALPALALAIAPTALPALAAVVAVAALSDAIDGTIARRLRQPTLLGAGLDPVVDGLFFGAVASGLAVGGAYPAWLAMVVVVRYALPVVVGGLMLGSAKLHGLRHTVGGQLSTALIAVLLGVIALFRGLGLDPGAVVTMSEILVPLATAITFANLAWAGWQLRRGR